MARMPIEVVVIGGVSEDDVARATVIANRVQAEFHYTVLGSDTAGELRLHSYRSAEVPKLLDALENCRLKLPGYHPFLIAVTDSELRGKVYNNLFGSKRAKKGIALFTIAKVPDIIIPSGRLVAYYLYYFARYALSFLTPEKKNHADPRHCIFDQKIFKLTSSTA